MWIVTKLGAMSVKFAGLFATFYSCPGDHKGYMVCDRRRLKLSWYAHPCSLRRVDEGFEEARLAMFPVCPLLIARISSARSLSLPWFMRLATN